MRLRITLVVAAVALAATSLPAQQYFGQNQVQYRHFQWRVLETDHFTIHFYPEEEGAITDAARMAERAYERLSRVLGHQFREKKPIILFASRSDFGQNNVTGDLGEGVGGVTEAGRHRLLLPFTGDYRSFEHVLVHELVHAFQYDIFARGKAGQGIDRLQRFDPPLWFREGMAEYLSIGPEHPLTAAWIRDAAINGTLPTIEQMTERPDKYFPYRFGEALFQYIGSRFGDEAIGELMQAVSSVGVERAFRRELGISTEQLSDEWREAMQTKYLPTVSALNRPVAFASPLLTPRNTRGEIFLAPALSPDGRYVAFLANGDPKRGDYFIDLWLGDGVTGKRIKKLVQSTTNPNFEELRLLYSQSSFSNDGTRLAFTGQRHGKDVLYIIDVRNQRTLKRIDLPIDGAMSPSWSPDDRRLVFSGARGGITDLYMVDVDGKNFRQLTSDKYGDLQPSWSPDGTRVVFASERGALDLDVLDAGGWKLNVMDVASGRITLLPGQAGHNLNPQWSPDGQSVAFISDRTGIPNVFLYEFGSATHYQITNVVSGVNAITEYSPAISWARQADRLAMVYYENGDYSVWTVNDPRSLRGEPFRAVARTAATDIPAVRGAAAVEPPSRPDQSSVYRAPGGSRPSSQLSAAELESEERPASISEMMAQPEAALPDTTRFKEYKYRPTFRADYIAQTGIGYTPNYMGSSGFAGGTTIIFSDLLGNHQIAASANVNGRIQDASAFVAYTNMSRRLQYATGAYLQPLILPRNNGFIRDDPTTGGFVVDQDFARFVQKNIFLNSMYPLNRFTRFELGAQFNSISQEIFRFSYQIFPGGFVSQPSIATVEKGPGLNYFSPNVAFVTDNAFFGYTGPLSGKRVRLELTPSFGSVQRMDYLADARGYMRIIPNTLTFATRVLGALAVGRDENLFPKYIGRPDFVRGYDQANFYGGAVECNEFLGQGIAGRGNTGCSTAELVGSRVLVANAEFRFPLIRRFDIGSRFGLPPLDAVVFYDAGLAWTKGQTVSMQKPDDYDYTIHRVPMTSWGAGVRMNLFGLAVLRFDYAIPLSLPDRKGNWTFSLGPSF
ncbi:DPP IV N-terminal domain-containing protein [soil metagenome]